ncbi:hypothetical protein IVB30_36540 [Bradyrhizobium sp. 200]|uniref:hypothetical protein n=1 Tax=Bradyrhizobium sp. 200 TaxID=2782665 RepID=UPI001FFF0972|nr:hypothetical protein [Bradyrhizobium sp. 200]UPJ48504.1 hypothetical protein IVB30_36540 [Bradyrhizobium sp. 200]
MLSLLETDFPTNAGFVRAKWAPLLLRPILGSPEQLVIGVAAVNEGGFHLERANSFARLTCLFSGEANSAILAAQAALDAFEIDLSSRALNALAEYQPIFSGVALGEIGDAEGQSLKSIASSWMASLSSLYSATAEIALVSDALVLADAPEIARPRDRLPALVLDYVKSKRAGLDRFFSEEIREQHARRRANASAVYIDFAGSRVVANFGTLSATHHVASVDRIKRRLWDLKVDRDNEKGGLAKRDHEMIVQHPSKTDPQFSERQLDRMEEALAALEQQADQEEIRFRPMNTINQIGDHLLAKEAA